MYAISLGGLGTRLMPLTTYLPKSLLEIGGKRIIDWQIDRLKEAGVTDIIVTAKGNHLKAGQHFLGEQYQGLIVHNVPVEYQESTVDLRLALRALPSAEQDFFLIYNDILTDADFNELLDAHRSNEAKPVVTLLTREVRGSLGVLTLTDKQKVTQIVDWQEKPPQDINESIYIVSKEIESYLEAPVGTNFSAKIMPQLAKEGRLYGVRNSAHWEHVRDLATYNELCYQPPKWLTAAHSSISPERR